MMWITLYHYLICQGAITLDYKSVCLSVLYHYLICQGAITPVDEEYADGILYHYLICQGAITEQVGRPTEVLLYHYLICQGAITIFYTTSNDGCKIWLALRAFLLNKTSIAVSPLTHSAHLAPTVGILLDTLKLLNPRLQLPSR